MEYIEIKEQIKQKLPVARDWGIPKSAGAWAFVPDDHASW